MLRIQHTDDKARAGALSSAHGDISTPAPLLYSFRGSPLNATSDIMDDLGGEPKALHVTATEFLEDPTPHQIASSGGAHSFFGQQGRLLLASARDPLRYNIHRWRSGRDGSLRVDTPKGHMDVPPARYMELLQAAQFDLAALLSDEVPCTASHRRSAQAVDKSLEWLQQALSQVTKRGIKTRLIACIQGGPFVPERTRHAEGIMQHDGVSGVMLGGLGTGEGPELRQELINASLSQTPQRLLRVLAAGIGSPLEALDAVACGVDLVDASFAVHATSAGHAMLLNPAEWRLHDAEAPEAPLPQAATPSRMQQKAPGVRESSQHAQRLHGKQRNPRNKPEVTTKAAQASIDLSPSAASTPVDDAQQQLSSGQATGSVHPMEPIMNGCEHTEKSGATDALQARDEATANLGDACMDRDVAELALQGRAAAARQLPASISTSGAMQNKRGMAEQAPSHVKHPRHKIHCAQGHVDSQPAGLQDGSAAAQHVGSAASRLGRKGGKGQKGSPAPGTETSSAEPELLSSQHALPASLVLDMWKERHRADARPLSELCGCSTCQRHSRAYVHHLLKTREMLAQVLLEIHNTHAICQFFVRIRKAIVDGELSALRSKFATRM